MENELNDKEKLCLATALLCYVTTVKKAIEDAQNKKDFELMSDSLIEMKTIRSVLDKVKPIVW